MSAVFRHRNKEAMLFTGPNVNVQFETRAQSLHSVIKLTQNEHSTYIHRIRTIKGHTITIEGRLMGRHTKTRISKLRNCFHHHHHHRYAASQYCT